MGILRDYLAYAKEHLHPTISEAAHQRLISVYVDMRKIGSGRGQISAYPRQLESLIRLSEAHAKVRLSNRVEVQDVDEAWRLHREALKQSATDPLSGKIDVGILTTGLSEASRKKRADLIGVIRDQLKKKGGVPTVPYQKLFTDIRESSEIVSTYLDSVGLGFRVNICCFWGFPVYNRHGYAKSYIALCAQSRFFWFMACFVGLFS